MLTEASVSSAALISTGVADVLTTIPKQSSSGENFNAGRIRRLSCSITASKGSGQLLGKSSKDVINFQPSSPRSGAQSRLRRDRSLPLVPSRRPLTQGEYAVTC